MKNILITTIVAVVFMGCAHSPQSNSKKFKSLNKSVHEISNGMPVESGPVYEGQKNYLVLL